LKWNILSDGRKRVTLRLNPNTGVELAQKGIGPTTPRENMVKVREGTDRNKNQKPQKVTDFSNIDAIKKRQSELVLRKYQGGQNVDKKQGAKVHNDSPANTPNAPQSPQLRQPIDEDSTKGGLNVHQILSASIAEKREKDRLREELEKKRKAEELARIEVEKRKREEEEKRKQDERLRRFNANNRGGNSDRKASFDSSSRDKGRDDRNRDDRNRDDRNRDWNRDRAGYGYRGKDRFDKDGEKRSGDSPHGDNTHGGNYGNRDYHARDGNSYGHRNYGDRNDHNASSSNREGSDDRNAQYGGNRYQNYHQNDRRSDDKYKQDTYTSSAVKTYVDNASVAKAPFKKDTYGKKRKSFSDDESQSDNKKYSSYDDNRTQMYSFEGSDDTDTDGYDRGFGRRRRNSKGFFKNKSKQNETPRQKILQEIELPEFISVSDLAEKMNEKKADVVKKLMSMGMVVTINQVIDADTAELVVYEFGHKVTKRTTEHDVENKLTDEEGTNFIARAPVVTIMGHVDHGKTSLLDAIRTTNVAEGESGGITQHIGASRVEVGEGKFITFIDTPGHEAFTEMRMRGASITDIVVLVVAADDGVKDQTVEAINHAKAANVPIILAINKIDKPGADPKRVEQELLQYNVVTENFGGEVMSVEVSAKQKINLDKLKETILLQAEIMDLKAPIDVKPSGAVVEARIDPNKGTIVSFLVQKGVLKVGDLVLAGTAFGRIRKMTNDKHKTQSEVMPSVAVEVLGLNSVPKAGDTFNVVQTEKEAREIITYRERKELESKVAKRSSKSLESMLKVAGGKSAKLLPVIIKADVNGSIEAIIGSLTKLNTAELEIDVVHSATGAINETDINLASVSGAIVLGFNVRTNGNALEIAKTKDIDIRYYSIIYNIVDDVKNILSGMLSPIEKEEITGHAEIRQIFKITGAGKVAGCFVLDGTLSRNDKVRLIRDGIVIYSGDLKALKRFKDDVKEVKSGYECGISIDNYDDIKEKDIIEGFKIVEEKRTL